MKEALLKSRSRRVRTVSVSPELLIDFLKVDTENNTVPAKITCVEDEIPADAKALRCWMERGNVLLLLEHESFDEVPDGFLVPHLTPVYELQAEPKDSIEDLPATGLQTKRLRESAGNPREVEFAKRWEKEQRHDLLDKLLRVPTTSDDPDRTPRRLGDEVGDFWKWPLGLATKRDKIVAATVVQWLGSNVGLGFLQEVFDRCGYTLKRKASPREGANKNL